MPLYTADALILRTYKLGESDRIVVFLTRDRGKKRGVAKNARQSRRRFGGALEPHDVRAGRLPRARAARPGACWTTSRPLRSPLVGGGRRGAGLRRVLRRADRRVGAGGRSERNAVPAGRLDGRRDCGGRADRAAGAVLRVLAAAAAGGVRVRARGCRAGRRRFWRSAQRAEPDRGSDGVAVSRADAARARAGASGADRDAPGEGPEVGARAAERCER